MMGLFAWQSKWFPGTGYKPEVPMTTTVTVKAYNFPATVTVTSRGDNMSSRSVYKLRDGQEQDFTVTDTQSVKVEERVADREPTGEN